MTKIITESESSEASKKLLKLRAVLNGVLFGQEDLIDLLVTGLFARGHILLEGLPGLGKTELIKGMARATKLDVRRIQFTPDLLPGDITGNAVLEDSKDGRRFVFRSGPIFTNIVLADEINRASPKTQSALLEAMQERRVSVLGESHILPDPFFVLATQNPIELEGTYPLPEAQLDRFLFKLEVLRTGSDVLERIVKERGLGVPPEVECVLSADEVLQILTLVPRVYLPDVVANYIARLVDSTHESNLVSGIKYGASPRAAIGLAAAARARALMLGRINTSFEDVQKAAVPVLAHRIVLDYSTRLQGRTARMIIEEVLSKVPTQDYKIPPVMEELQGAAKA